MLGVALASALGCLQTNRGPGPVVPPFPTGAFEDDYGGRHTVSATTWEQGASARYRILRWNAEARYLIAQNDSANPSDGGKWTRIDWIPLTGMPPYTWAFCFSAWNAESAEAAEAVRIARPDTPRTGCNGFPYSRLKSADAR